MSSLGTLINSDIMYFGHSIFGTGELPNPRQTNSRLHGNWTGKLLLGGSVHANYYYNNDYIDT